MEQWEMLSKVIRYQKAVTDNAFAIISIFQTGGEKILRTTLDHQNWIPEKERKDFLSWSTNYQQITRQMQAFINKGYEEAERLLPRNEKNTEKPKEKSVQSQDSSIQLKAVQPKEVAVQSKETMVQPKETAIQSKETVVQPKETSVQSKNTVAQTKDTAVQLKGTLDQPKDIQTATKTADTENAAATQKKASPTKREVTKQKRLKKIIEKKRPLLKTKDEEIEKS